MKGTSIVSQYGREADIGPGDFLVTDGRQPGVFVTGPGGQGLNFEVPRKRLERVLGPAGLYTALRIGAEQGGASLARTFFAESVRVGPQLSTDAAARMADTGLDLIVASIAETLSRELPGSMRGTVVVQRAKAYVEAHLGDPDFGPAQLAGAIGVSLRHLQELFHERGQYVADLIWRRRLDRAARCLADASLAHMSIGALSMHAAS